jgi:hypothetical protein
MAGGWHNCFKLFIDDIASLDHGNVGCIAGHALVGVFPLSRWSKKARCM